MAPVKTQDERIEIRVAGEDLERWRATADAFGLTLAAWIRQQCNAAAVDADTIKAVNARSKKGGKR